MLHLQNKVQQCIIIKQLKWWVMEILEKLKQRELVSTECLTIKMCFKFLFKTAAVCDHLFTCSQVHLGDSSTLLDQKKGTFTKFCTQSRCETFLLLMPNAPQIVS